MSDSGIGRPGTACATSPEHFNAREQVSNSRESLLNKSYILIPFVLLCAALAAAILAPILKPGVDAIRGKDNKLYRVAERCATGFALILFIALRKHMKSRVKASLDPKLNPPFKPLISGFLTGLVSLLALAAVITVLGGGHFINPHITTGVFWRALGMALLTAVCVALLEEIFFRGIVFQGLHADLGAGLATVVACAFFSLVHFMRPEKMPDISGSDPLGGFKVFFHAFDRYADFNQVLPFAIGLFLIGILLVVAYLKTSALYLPIGLHASLVFYSKLDYVFFEYDAKASAALFGSQDPYPSFLKGVDAVLTWIMVVVLTIVIALIGSKLQSRGGEAVSSGKASPK